MSLLDLNMYVALAIDTYRSPTFFIADTDLHTQGCFSNV